MCIQTTHKCVHSDHTQVCALEDTHEKMCAYVVFCCRFLESLANCSVTVTDERRGYTVEMPGYSKYSTKDLKAQAGEHGRVHASRFGSMEEVQIDFTAKEFYNACSSGYLPVGTQ